MRSADASCNPYIVFKLLLAAGFEGIENKMPLSEKTFTCGSTSNFDELPGTLGEAVAIAEKSDFVKNNLSEEIYETMFSHLSYTLTKYNLADDKSKFEDEFYFNCI